MKEYTMRKAGKTAKGKEASITRGKRAKGGSKKY